MLKKIIFIICILICTSMNYASNLNHNDKITVLAGNNVGDDKSSSISASIDGHNLTIIFLANLGQVTIKVLDAYDVEIELMSTPTPTGQIIYIPLAGRYTVLFTLSDGDVYYGEFEVTD